MFFYFIPLEFITRKLFPFLDHALLAASQKSASTSQRQLGRGQRREDRNCRRIPGSRTQNNSCFYRPLELGLPQIRHAVRPGISSVREAHERCHLTCTSTAGRFRQGIGSVAGQKLASTDPVHEIQRNLC